MTDQTAKAIKNQIEQICNENGLWVDITESRKPDLKNITITISIRVKK